MSTVEGLQVPQFKHDCEVDIFLGRYFDETQAEGRKLADLYVHPPTINARWRHRGNSGSAAARLGDAIARYSDEGSDYGSFDLDQARAHARRYPEAVYAEIIRRWEARA